MRINDEAIEIALEMSPRYIRHLHLPDKVIGWLDTASVRAEIERRLRCADGDAVGHLTRREHPGRHGVPRSHRSLPRRRGAARRASGRPEEGHLAVARRLVLNKGPLKDSGFDRPDGVLLFLGPTGVGKTELAKAVAEFMFGDEKRMIRIDMSELPGRRRVRGQVHWHAAGIVGSEQGGVLTNQLRDTPCSVVLLDEIEKASPNVLNLFLQAFDEGWLTDGRGRRVYLSGRDRHHDFEHRVGPLSQAHEPARLRFRRHTNGDDQDGNRS